MAAPSDLVSLTTLKQWLNLTTTDAGRDANLALLITAISRAILTKMQRPNILPATYTETRDGCDERAIILRNWPVTKINSVSVGGQPVTCYDLEPAEYGPPGQPQDLTLLQGRFWRGRRNVSVSYVAGYQVSDEAITVPDASPWQASVAAPFGAWASDAGVSYAAGGALTAIANGTPTQGQYIVANGQYTFAEADAGASVLVSYGYVPADLANAALEWITDRYNYQSRIGLRAKTLGGQETISYIVKDIPDFVMLAIQGYMNVVPL